MSLKEEFRRFQQWLFGPIGVDLARYFRVALAFKMLCTFAGMSRLPLGPTRLCLLLVLFLALGLTASRRYSRYGFLIYFGAVLHQVIRTFPLTINHFLLELLILFILLLFPTSPHDPEKSQEVDGTALRILQINILFVWFYSGIQKLVHGYYLNGEMFALTTFFEPADGLGRSLQAVSSFFSTTKFPLSVTDTFANIGIPLNHAQQVFFLGASWFTVLMELSLPLMMLFRQTRGFASVSLVVAQILVGISAGELDFTLTGVGVLLLFIPRSFRWTYSLYAVACMIFLFRNVAHHL